MDYVKKRIMVHVMLINCDAGSGLAGTRELWSVFVETKKGIQRFVFISGERGSFGSELPRLAF